MKFASRGDCFTIYVLKNDFLDVEIKEYVKKMVLRLKNRFRKYISGYYKAYVYINDCYGMIIDLIKEEDFAELGGSAWTTARAGYSGYGTQRQIQSGGSRRQVVCILD